MIKLQGRLGLECPRCKSLGLFNYASSKDKRYGPNNFYCETCDAGHQTPITRSQLEKRGVPKKGKARPKK
jgi:hypothetical protein